MSLLLDEPAIEPLADAVDEFETEMMADLLNRLGGIPASRVFLKPSPGTATVQDVLNLHDRTNRLAELIDGTLVEKPMGMPESWLANTLTYFTESHLTTLNLGFTAGEGGMLRLSNRNVRIPDFSFFRWERFPDRKRPKGQIPEITPDLAVEILSPSNTRREMEIKRHEYFKSGAQIVWEVEPETKIVRVYSGPETCTTIDENGTLSGGDVLPGFTLSVKAWFDRAFREG